MAHVAVIGAGVAGIAAAIRLALKGWQVTVFEANDYPGGKLSAFSLDGFRFDAGPSLLTMPQLIDELFTAAGRDPRDYFRYRKLDVACHYFYEDGTRLSAPADPERFVAEAERVLKVPGIRLRQHLASAQRKFELTEGIFLSRSLHKAGSYLQADVLRAGWNLPQLHLTQTMHSQNSRALGHPKLVQLFDRFATYNGSNPYEASAVLNLIPYLEHGMGAAFPVGGMVAITESLVRLAQELGVEIRLGQRVDRIALVDGKAVGVEVAGQLHAADLVVSNMDVVPTYRKLLAGHAAPERTLRREPSSSAMVFYWGINTEFPDLDLHNIFFSEDYAAEFKGIFGKNGLHPDPTVYVHISSKFEAGDAPQGMENWFVMVNVPADDGQDWERLRAETRARVLAKLTRLLGRNVASHIVAEATLDPPTIAARTGSHRGALYGASSNSTMSAFLRHPNFSSDIKNLYFCGGSVHPGGGIPLCLLSARIVADLVPAP